MILLRILSGKMAGTETVIRHFPFRVGRAPGSQLRLEEPGVWDQHFVLERKTDEGWSIQSQPAAMTLLNGERVQRQRLRNGDLIEAGAVKLRFWLAPAPQLALGWREALTWAALAVLAAVEATVMLLLTR